MTTTITMHVGDVRDVMATLADGSVDLLVTSPPFLALRSYLPADHPDKHREIGSEATPATFLDTLLGLTADWRRIVTDTGSICVEIGDTYSGSGGAGGDYLNAGLRDGQPAFDGSGARNRAIDRAATYDGGASDRFDFAKPGTNSRAATGPGWPLAKSLTLVPTLYTASLAYGRNLLTGQDSPAGKWRIRNLLTWTRPNPPVGALGDKFRPGTSFVTVACVSGKRWFDLDAVRQADTSDPRSEPNKQRNGTNYNTLGPYDPAQTAGAPPLDWWDANDLDADELAEHWQPLHRLPTAPYKGSHYATYPVALPLRLIEAMCPREVCVVCEEPRRRIVDVKYVGAKSGKAYTPHVWQSGITDRAAHSNKAPDEGARVVPTTIGWTDCRCAVPVCDCPPPWADCTHPPDKAAYRPGIVLDPFGGSGTTAIAAARAGRDAVLIDLDDRNVALVRERIRSSLRVVDEKWSRRGGPRTNEEGRAGRTPKVGAPQRITNVITWTVEPPLPKQADVDQGQTSIFDLDGAAS